MTTQIFNRLGKLFLIQFIILSFLISGCSGTTTTDAGAPTAPESTAALFPQDSATGVGVSGVTLTWGAFSGEESLVLQIDTDISFPGASLSALVLEEISIDAGQTSYTLPDGLLQPATEYFWRVIARNSNGDRLYGPFSFTTASLVASCTPSPESCDGVDNDCDGVIDDGVCSCGNGIIEPFAGESCDDGNLIGGDGCSLTCQTQGWVHPLSLSDHIDPTGSDSDDPQVAMDNNGNAIVVWEQHDGNHSQIFMSEYRNGSWTHPASLTDKISPDGNNASNPQVAMDNNGNAIVVWQQDTEIFMSEYRQGAWDHPDSLSDHISIDDDTNHDPQVAMDNNGNAIITWVQRITGVFISEYRQGAWTHPNSQNDKISPGFFSVDSQFPQVAMDNNGNAIVVWVQSNQIDSEHLFISEYRGGVWDHPDSLTDYISLGDENAEGPQVAMDNNNNALITWFQESGGEYQIFLSEYRGGSWTHPASLADNISPDESSAYGSQVAMDDNGNAIIAWSQESGGDDQIFLSEYRAGAWTHPTSDADNISPDGIESTDLKVAMDNNGHALIVWRQEDGAAETNIAMSEYRNGSWTHPSSFADTIEPDVIGISDSARKPQVAMDNNGNALIVWEQHVPSESDDKIFLSEYR